MPALSCGQRCLQIMLIVFNIVVFICGIALVAVGLVACISLNRYSKDIDATVYGFAVFLIVLGVVIFFLGIIGCCGACNESVYKLTLYSLLLFVIIVSEFASSVGALVLKEKVKEKLTIAVKDAVQDYNKNPDLKSVVDEIQEAIGCCGADSPSDYDTPPQSCYDNGELFKTVLFYRKS
ncbi:unnamed protein product [Heterobilharzia americana]|nr:unnamed protein product [Heterobilharzia americana]CAH8452127.1 unnamed protein product [Heterobilharzia americana]